MRVNECRLVIVITTTVLLLSLLLLGRIAVFASDSGLLLHAE